ncbi:MAG: alkaline phosphatase family protein, partial [Muribaculaceae bacterium]|nr:alkaline phosphatase family protein [Muribaculaceae bacterium]
MLKLSRLNILMSLVASLTSLSISAASPQSPKLLVGIMVEGLDGDCLELLRGQFGEGGFRRLENKGLTIAQADYGSYLDAAAAAAEVMTGASPSVNGIPAEYIYDPEARRGINIYADAASMGNYTNASYSPSALRVSTIADEVRIASGGINVVYAVAANPAVSLALAGHAGNSALWLDTKTGNWASSTYYKEMPVAVAARNRMAPLSSRLDTMSWTPS